MKIVLATKNPKKVVELQRMAPSSIEILCLKDVEEALKIPQAEETGETFIENARIKALYWAEKLQMPAIGEDSGIEIDALNGAPGVYTKRCMEKYCPSEDINVDNPRELYPKILEVMASSGNASKKAKWVSAIVLALPNGESIEAVSSLSGEMCECAGDHEFGFDQYFKPDGFEETLSQLAPAKKDEIGPRRKAFMQVLEQKIN